MQIKISYFWLNFKSATEQRSRLKFITCFHFSCYPVDCLVGCFRSTKFSSMESLEWKRFISNEFPDPIELITYMTDDLEWVAEGVLCPVDIAG